MSYWKKLWFSMEWALKILLSAHFCSTINWLILLKRAPLQQLIPDSNLEWNISIYVCISFLMYGFSNFFPLLAFCWQYFNKLVHRVFHHFSTFHIFSNFLAFPPYFNINRSFHHILIYYDCWTTSGIFHYFWIFHHISIFSTFLKIF